MSDFFKSRLFWIALIGSIVALLLPLKVSGYILGLLTVAYYFGVFSMAWDLLFGFAGEVNFGPTFLIGLGAYTAGILNGYGVPVYPCIAAGAAMAVIGGVVLALPALRVRGPYFGLTTLVAVLIMMNLIVVFAGFTGGEIGLTVPDVLSVDTDTNYYIAQFFILVISIILFYLSPSPVVLLHMTSMTVSLVVCEV